MIARLYTCFGWSGVLSAAAWLAAVAVVCIFFRRAGRERRFALAVALALAGVGLAWLNAVRTSAIQLDRTDEIRAAYEAQQRLLAQEEQARRDAGETVVRFAEDAPGESVGVPTLAREGEVGTMPVGEGEPAYRAGGKQKRTPGKERRAAASNASPAYGEYKAEPVKGVTLKLPEYQLANRLTRMNSLLARLALLLAVGVLVNDYLRRFNHPADAYAPLPLAGPWVDAFSPKPSLVLWPAADPARLRQLLADVVRRGQTFVYVGDRLGASDVDTARLGLLWRAWRRLPVLTWGAPGVPADPDVAFDGAWFNRYAVFVPGASAAPAVRAFLERLGERAKVRAQARQLPHIVLDIGNAADVGTIRTLGDLCAACGARLVLVGIAPPPDRAARYVRVAPLSASSGPDTRRHA